MSSTLSCGLGKSVFAGWNGKLTIDLNFAKTRYSSLQFSDEQTDVVAQKKNPNIFRKSVKVTLTPRTPEGRFYEILSKMHYYYFIIFTKPVTLVRFSISLKAAKLSFRPTDLWLPRGFAHTSASHSPADQEAMSVEETSGIGNCRWFSPLVFFLPLRNCIASFILRDGERQVHWSSL